MVKVEINLWGNYLEICYEVVQENYNDEKVMSPQYKGKFMVSNVSVTWNEELV